MQGSEIGRFRGDHPVWLLIPLAKDQRQEMDCMQREITAKKGGKLQNVNPIFFPFSKGFMKIGCLKPSKIMFDF